MNDKERAAQDKALKNLDKKVKAAKIQQELIARIFGNGTLIKAHGYDPLQLGVDIMMLNTHQATKDCYHVLTNNEIPFGDNEPYQYSNLVSKNSYNSKKDPDKPRKPYGQKAKMLRELAITIATLADSMDIIDKWADDYVDD